MAGLRQPTDHGGTSAARLGGELQACPAPDAGRQPAVLAQAEVRDYHRFRSQPAGVPELGGEDDAQVDQLWRADITYIRLEAEFVYLAVVLDAFSRRMIGWALDRTLKDSLTLEALRMALAHRTGVHLVHHSGPGV